MWPGQQPPGGEQNPQNNPYQQPGYQQPNPYQQPGYQQQPGPYGQQPQWGAHQPPGRPEPPTVVGGGGGGGGNRTKLVAIVAALAVVVAAGVTGFLVLGGDKDDTADDGKDKPTASASADKSASPTAEPSASGGGDDPRGGGELKPTVEGWKVVANPRFGTMFDVPADWEIDSTDTSVGFEWEEDGKTDRTTVTAPAYLKSEWCTEDSI
jgi:hypothetical protein